MRFSSRVLAIIGFMLLLAAAVNAETSGNYTTEVIVDSNGVNGLVVKASLDENAAKQDYNLSALTCTYSYSDESACDSSWPQYRIEFTNGPNGWQESYEFVDCTTGQVLNSSILCVGEQSPWYTRPAGHSVKFTWDYYACSTCGEDLPGQACTEAECDQQNYYESTWDYYCGGSDSWKRQKYHNYDCGQNGCYYEGWEWRNPQYVESCSNGCTNGACNTDLCPGVTCENYCSGSTLNYNGTCNPSDGSCNYNTQNCDSQDGYVCTTGNVREYRNYSCSGNGCNYTISDSRDCDNEDRYGDWEYYCSGNDRWKKRMFYDYGCSSGNCNVGSQNYVDDQLVETCSYGCSGGLCSGCSGSITVDVENYEDNPVIGAEVYLDGQLQGTTGADGRIALSASSSSCPASYSVRVNASDGTQCGTRGVTLSNSNDSGFMMFTCNVQQPQLRMSVATGEPHYLGDGINLGIELTDDSSNLIDAASIGIWDPFRRLMAWKTTVAGIVEYLTQATKTGYFTFWLSGSKIGYESVSASKEILVKGYGEIVVIAETKAGDPIEMAEVKLNGASIGSTNAEGRFAVEVGQGTHTIEVCKNGSCQSKTTEISHNGDVDEVRIVCTWCSGNLAVAIVSPELSPISNAYIQLDGAQAEVTNTSGAVYFKDKALGNHTVKVFLLIKESPDQNAQYFEATTQIDLNSAYQLKKFILTTQGITPLSADENHKMLIIKSYDVNLEMEPAAVVKGRIQLSLDQPIMQPISLENDICVKDFWLKGMWPTECDEKNTWVADESLITTEDSIPIALSCTGARCFRDSGISIASYIYKPYVELFKGTNGVDYTRVTYTERGSGIPEACLKKLKIPKQLIVSHINNKVAIPGIPKSQGGEIYNQHIGRYAKNGEECTVFYESAAFADSKGIRGCEESCEKTPKDYIKKPPVPYPGVIPSEELNRWMDKVIKHNNVENGWPSMQGYDPFISIGIPTGTTALIATAFIYWQLTKPIRCAGGIAGAPATGGLSALALCIL